MNKLRLALTHFLIICLWWPLQVVAVASGAEGNSTAPTATGSEGTVRFFNRDIVTFRSSLYGVSAPDRARRAQIRLHEQLDQPGPYKISQKPESAGIMVQINGATTFFVTPDDANRLQNETLEAVAQRTASALDRAITESQESRNWQAVSHALARAGLATGVALTLGWLLVHARRTVAKKLRGLAQQRAHGLHLAGVKLLHQNRLASMLDTLLKGLFQLLLFVLFYEWLSFVLSSFPFTRAWGELLNSFLWELMVQMGTSIAGAIPGLFTALIIFYLARTSGRMLDGLFERIRTGKVQVTWLEAEMAEPTRRIVKATVWLFALAMAYPYLPGAQTEAFKGLSVLVGLMISLGSSNLVSQAASGLILTYGRVFRRGEYVRIGQHEGTVTDMGLFATRIRTGLGEELTLSNAAVLNESTKNYSRAVKGHGFVLDTTVTIGYDTPWRQVYALLEEAARRTPGVLVDPAPQVFQTALSDWYPQYRLVCQAIPSEPRPRALVLSVLHANIQDVFNEYGVQIMSPQYFEDPATPKIVPPEKWYAPPAKPTEVR
jgi:small-conductance mechanosensitive channel